MDGTWPDLDLPVSWWGIPSRVGHLPDWYGGRALTTYCGHRLAGMVYLGPAYTAGIRPCSVCQRAYTRQQQQAVARR